MARLGEMSLIHNKEGMVESNLVSKVWDQVMAGLHCCGVHNYSDFTLHTKQWRGYRQVVPPSCCILSPTFPLTITPEDSHCTTTPTRYNSYWTQVTDITLPHLPDITAT